MYRGMHGVLTAFILFIVIRAVGVSFMPCSFILSQVSIFMFIDLILNNLA